IPMGRMADIINVTAAWITGTLDEMERKGYITKIRSLNDRRIVNVRLTETGNEKLMEGKKIYNEFISNTLSALNENDRVVFRQILEKMEAVLE
ncbi:MAG: MarR family winged helix-turn-helix transcriptional regulator, partial [Thermoplasmata archaeon]